MQSGRLGGKYTMGFLFFFPPKLLFCLSHSAFLLTNPFKPPPLPRLLYFRGSVFWWPAQDYNSHLQGGGGNQKGQLKHGIFLFLKTAPLEPQGLYLCGRFPFGVCLLASHPLNQIPIKLILLVFCFRTKERERKKEDEGTRV